MGRALRDVIVMEWTVSLCLTLVFLPILVNCSAWFEYNKPAHEVATLYSFKTANEHGTMRHMKETGTLGIIRNLPFQSGYGTGAQEHGRGHHGGMLQRGSEVYSVLGLLSFATFIFSVLYNRYKMKNGPTNRRPFQGGGAPLPAAPPTPAMMSAMTPAPTRNDDFMSEENLMQMLKRASKIFSKVVDEDNLGSGYNSTSLFTSNPDEADYYDLDFDESQHSESE